MTDIFMANKDNEVLSRIIVEHYDKRYIVESPYSDSQPLDGLLDLVYGILLMSGYTSETITDAMVEFAEEHGYKQNLEEL